MDHAEVVAAWEEVLDRQACINCGHGVLCHEVDADGPRVLVACHHCDCAFTPTRLQIKAWSVSSPADNLRDVMAGLPDVIADAQRAAMLEREALHVAPL